MESTIYTVAGKQFELQHHGVKGMKWGRRKQPEPYRQDLGGGVSAVWPSKKAFKKAERQRIKAEKKQKRQAIIEENLAREREALPTAKEVAKLGVKVAAVSAIGVAALAGVISAVGNKTPSQAANYANVGRAFVDTISIPTVPISTIPVGRVSW